MYKITAEIKENAETILREITSSQIPVKTKYTEKLKFLSNDDYQSFNLEQLQVIYSTLETYKGNSSKKIDLLCQQIKSLMDNPSINYRNSVATQQILNKIKITCFALCCFIMFRFNSKGWSKLSAAEQTATVIALLILTTPVILWLLSKVASFYGCNPDKRQASISYFWPSSPTHHSEATANPDPENAVQIMKKAT